MPRRISFNHKMVKCFISEGRLHPPEKNPLAKLMSFYLTFLSSRLTNLLSQIIFLYILFMNIYFNVDLLDFISYKTYSLCLKHMKI